MDETGFDELDQAAVAGAEGTAWTMPEFSACPTLTPVSPFHSFTPDSPFDSFSSDHPSHTSPISTCIPISSTIKNEPQYLDISLVPSSPPTQPSLCSVESEQDFNNKTKQNIKTMIKSQLDIKPCQSKKSSSSSKIISSSIKHCKNSIITKDKNTKSTSLLDLSVTTNDFTDLKGTTAARSRKMTEEERKIMLHKRRLRNRASAARSREKRSRTLTDLTAEVEELMKKATNLAKQAAHFNEENRKLKAKNVLLIKENELLKAELKM